MRYLKRAMIGIGVFAMIMSFSGAAFSETMGYDEGKGVVMTKEMLDVHIKTLRDSAAALLTSNPMLAKELNDLADKKAEKMKKWQESKMENDARIKVLTDSATALKTSNPVLADELKMMVEKPMKEGGKNW